MEDKTFELLTEMYSEITKQLKEINYKLDEKADKADLAGKADKTDLIGKADKTDLVGKADKTDIVMLENKLIPKIEALFDGYQQHTDVLERIENELTRHDEMIAKIK